MSATVTVQESMYRPIAGSPSVVQAPARGADKPVEASPGRFKAFMSRMFERLRQYREDRMFEQLMREDPRVYADIQAAAARQERR